MLDAYIIDRIRRERERAQREQVPLHIERMPPPVRRDDRPEHDKEQQDRGSVVVDFQMMTFTVR